MIALSSSDGQAEKVPSKRAARPKPVHPKPAQSRKLATRTLIPSVKKSESQTKKTVSETSRVSAQNSRKRFVTSSPIASVISQRDLTGLSCKCRVKKYLDIESLARLLYGRVEALSRTAFQKAVEVYYSFGKDEIAKRWVDYGRTFEQINGRKELNRAGSACVTVDPEMEKCMGDTKSAKSRKNARRKKASVGGSLCVGTIVDVYWNGENAW